MFYVFTYFLYANFFFLVHDDNRLEHGFSKKPDGVYKKAISVVLSQRPSSNVVLFIQKTCFSQYHIFWAFFFVILSTSFFFLFTILGIVSLFSLNVIVLCENSNFSKRLTSKFRYRMYLNFDVKRFEKLICSCGLQISSKCSCFNTDGKLYVWLAWSSPQYCTWNFKAFIVPKHHLYLFQSNDF